MRTRRSARLAAGPTPEVRADEDTAAAATPSQPPQQQQQQQQQDSDTQHDQDADWSSLNDATFIDTFADALLSAVGRHGQRDGANAAAQQEALHDTTADVIGSEDTDGDAADARVCDSTTAGDDDDDLEVDEQLLHWKPDVQLPRAYDAHDVTVGDISMTDAALEKQLRLGPIDRKKQLKEARRTKRDTAGKAWFDLPAQQITDEVKRDLRLLRLRGAFDSKRFYKSFDNTKFPKHFQFGTVVEGAQEFYSSRLPRRQRARSLTAELLADPDLREQRKKRFDKLQEAAQQWSHIKRPFKKSKRRPKH